MLNVNQLRNGKTYEEDGTPLQVVKYDFTKMGRGTGNVKVKVRNLVTGSVTTKTYTTGNKVQDIQLIRKKMQYLYNDGASSVFMDPVSFEQVEIDNNLIADQRKFLQDGAEIQVLFWEEKALSLELPSKLTFAIKDTDPGAKGNSAANVFKSATLENGMEVRVPLFIKKGEKVVVSTENGEYVAKG